jgi:hypothetical protein
VVVALLFGVVTDYTIFSLSRLRRRMADGRTSARHGERATAHGRPSGRGGVGRSPRRLGGGSPAGCGARPMPMLARVRDAARMHSRRSRINPRRLHARSLEPTPHDDGEDRCTSSIGHELIPDPTSASPRRSLIGAIWMLLTLIFVFLAVLAFREAGPFA